MTHQRLEHRELARGQLNRTTLDAGSARSKVQGHPRSLEYGRLSSRLVAEPDPDPRQKLLEPEGLGDVVVPARIQPLHLVVEIVASGEDDHRKAEASVPQLAEHRQAVDVRKTQVEHDEVELAIVGESPRGIAVRGHLRRVSVRAQPLLQEAGESCLVLDDQDPAHAISSVGCCSTGTTTSNRAPEPGSLLSSTRPPCASAIARTMASPRPTPS